ncbi:hypothetical protein VCRA2113O324_10075 [Vibrio crassostreae]|nr:hypothetical protein VCRA2113O324_10075 [Vibrio crassostreae]CAK1984912.1 hypothetical protein VCRA2111O320_20075 [Vibrio crassostreae]CAK2717601.1 hypothetical protein VCRA2121O336_10075 [Vibrio crassostreae]CAK3201612.1 hypothetical protein VCRA2121O334_160019 [Vibrio crassostreae]CAK3309392.1 hypothetical protein VCRA217O315_10075 [Vibrio crassostreae]
MSVVTVEKEHIVLTFKYKGVKTFFCIEINPTHIVSLIILSKSLVFI